MPRPSKWNSPTTAIRVPAALADELLSIAREREGLELSESFVQNSPADEDGLTAVQAALVSRLVDQTIASCDAQGLDPGKLLLALKRRELLEFLSHFRSQDRKEFVARLVDEVFSWDETSRTA